MDYIEVRDLLIFANHGVFDEEKKLGQKFYVDMRLGLDTQPSAMENNLQKSVHYGELANQIVALFQKESHDLIETCAEEIAQHIFDWYPMVMDVEITVKKPWAPILLPVENVLVRIHRKRHHVFLSLGSNLGDSRALLEKAIAEIQNPYTHLVQASDFLQTKAWGMQEQPDFLNAVIEIQTTYEPMTLLRHLQQIELKLGRTREIHWGPRTVDIDILFFDNEIIYTDELIVPHPYIEERAFVLEPMNQIAPHYIHPVQRKPIRTLWKILQDN